MECTLRIAAIALTTSCILGASSASATFVSSYDFNEGLNDTLGSGNDVIASGGTVAGGVYTFSANQGLRLTDALADTSSYAIEIRFRITDSVSGYNKLIDFQDLASDLGLYVYDGALEFHALGSGGGTISLNEDVTFGLARTSGVLSGFVNGTQIFSATDISGQAVPADNVLSFFEDDDATSQLESFAGFVDWIRIYDSAAGFGTVPDLTPGSDASAVPLPAAAPLLLAGLGGLLALRRRRGL